MRAVQRAEPWREEAGHPFARRQADHAAPVVAEGHAPAVDRGDRIGHALGHRQEVLAPPGQAMAVRPALEQARAEVTLEFAQVTDERGLAEPEHTRGPPQAAGLSHREKDPQIVPLHRASLATLGAPAALRIRSRAIRS